MAGPYEQNFLTKLAYSGLNDAEQAELLRKLETKEQTEGVYTWPEGLQDAFNKAVAERVEGEQQQMQGLAGTQTGGVVSDDGDPPVSQPPPPVVQDPTQPQDPPPLIQDPTQPQDPQPLIQDPGTPATAGAIYAGDPPPGGDLPQDPPAQDPPAQDPPAQDPAGDDPPAQDPGSGDGGSNGDGSTNGEN
jgi:hypothetical protein